MNLDWILSPLTMYGAMASGWIALFYLTFSCRVEMAREHKRKGDENELLRENVAQLSAKIKELAAEPREREAPRSADIPVNAMNINKRWEALRMFRHGADLHTIAGALGMPLAEISLLHTVQGIVAEQCRATEVPRPEAHAAGYPSAPSAHAISNRREYSPEA